MCVCVWFVPPPPLFCVLNCFALKWAVPEKESTTRAEKYLHFCSSFCFLWKSREIHRIPSSTSTIINSNYHLRHLSPSSSTRCVISAQFPRQASLHWEPSVSPFSVKAASAAANPISSTRLHLHPHLQLWMNEWNESIRGNRLAAVFIHAAPSDIPLLPPPPPTLISFSLAPHRLTSPHFTLQDKIFPSPQQCVYQSGGISTSSKVEIPHSKLRNTLSSNSSLTNNNYRGKCRTAVCNVQQEQIETAVKVKWQKAGRQVSTAHR